MIDSTPWLTERHGYDPTYDVNISCTFCKFRDICFRKEDDILDVAKDDKLTFLGGEVDA